MPHGANWEKAPADLAERFTATVSAMPGAQVRKMFGYPAGFVNGQHVHRHLRLVLVRPPAR